MACNTKYDWVHDIILANVQEKDKQIVHGLPGLPQCPDLRVPDRRDLAYVFIYWRSEVELGTGAGGNIGLDGAG